MTWANCSTHGPIQDASTVIRGGVVTALVCSCGLEAEPYTPESFVDHDELKELTKAKRQPKADHVEPDSPEIGDEAEDAEDAEED